ncbi:MAG: hypothetical protein KAH95_00125 [Spirochaetales bacterium]|nr:hypothetical protein [Spirochaetales bacterium]
MIKIIKLFFIILIFSTPQIHGQTILLPDEEAPESIFSISPGGAEVDLYMLGTWESDLRGGLGYSWNSEDSSLIESYFPGMTSGLILSHSPDIFISLWLMNSYFFETSFIDNYELNTILFGYEAIDENFIQSVRIGNTDIGFGDYSYLSIPEASADSMGGMALFKNDKSEHQFMIRYDPAEMQKKSFIGQYEVDPTRVDVSNYVTGRYFILPDDNVEDLMVYIEDSSGTYSDGSNRRYKLADSEDAIISAEEGIVFFRESLNVRAAVHYTKGGIIIGNALLGIDALAADNSNKIDLDLPNDDFFLPAGAGTKFYLGQDLFYLKLLMDGSETALLLYEPGAFSPFEMLSVYSLPYLIPDDPALFKTSLTDINLTNGEILDTLATFEDYMVRVLYNGESYRDPANRYPLAEKIDTDTLIYEPDKMLNGSPPDKELFFQRLYPAGGYYLGDNVLEGSVAVKMNGLNEYRYTFNADSGNVTFLFPVPTDTQIDIQYRTMASTGTSGDLLIALGSKFNFSDNFSMDTGLGLRWNVLDSNYIEQPGDASGSIIGTAGLSYKAENIDFKLDAGISIYSPNTTGILRLAGMNSGGFSVPISADLLYPAAPPPLGSYIETVLSFVPDNSNRGDLIYKDFHNYDASGGFYLEDYDWTSPKTYPYADGGRTGPYIAGTDSEIEGNSAIFEYSLGDSEWTGGRIPLTLGSSSIDLSNIQSISLKWKHLPDTAGDISMYIRLGSMNEDIDDDSFLDKESSIYDSGFTFNDNTYAIKIGLAADGNGGNNQIDTEDLNGNNLLDGEGPNISLETGLTLNAVTDWATLTINLTPTEREKLRSSNAFEIILAEDGASSGGSGRLLIGDITLSGSSFIIKPAGLQEVSVKEVNEIYSSLPSPLLTTSYPEVSIFSSGSGAQNITEINWDATPGEWEATTFVEAVDLFDYNKISFYMKTPSTIPGGLTFSLTNPSDQGISISFIPSGNTNWVKYTVDYRNKILSADGTNVIGVTWNKQDFDSTNVNRLTLSADSASVGFLLIDEVHMEEPVVGVSGAASTVFNFKKPGTILNYKNTAILSDFNFGNSSSIKGPNFASGFTDNRDSTIYTATNMDISLFILRLSGNLNLQWQNTELYSSPGLSFTLPLLDNGIVITDTYNEINLPLTNSTYRESTVSTKLGFTSFILSADSSVNDNNLVRNWGINSATTWDEGSKLSASTDFRLSGYEDPYSNMDTFEKFLHSYTLYLPEDVQNDRNTGIIINPVFNLNTVSLEVNENLISNVSGTDERVLNTSQSLSLDAGFSFNPDSLKQWNFGTGYTKTIQGIDDAVNDNNFFTDTGNSILYIVNQNYYYAGIPLWEIFYPDFEIEYKNKTNGQISTKYIPEFSLQLSRLSGSRPVDIFLPSFLNVIMSRNLNRDFDSVTDSMNINFETRATALNVFGKLGTTPLINWYQTEEITNIFAINGEYRSYGTEIFSDPVFSLNYSLYLNFSLSQKNSVNFQSNQSLELLPIIWNSTSTGSFNWQVIPNKIIVIPLLSDKNEENKPYFEHKEKLTVYTNKNFENKETSFTLTANHSTDLIFTDKGNISIFAGIGIDQKSITSSESLTKYYLLGIEAGISAKLTF